MRVKPFRQTTCEGCLPICLLLLAGKKPSAKKEMELLFCGLKKSRDYYFLGMLRAFVGKYKHALDVYVDNKYFRRELQKDKDTRLHFIHRAINKKLLDCYLPPYILEIDHFHLGSYTHSPHFVLVEKVRGNNVWFIDPWVGRRRRTTKAKLLFAIESLRKHIRFCPLLISLKRT